jgi:virulence factor
MSSDGRLKVGVIGAGGIARSMHLPSLGDMPDVEVVALCDLIEQRATEQAARYNVPRTYTLYREMLAKERLDAVFVLVEPSNLFHVVMGCLEAGLHTFMEKPPGITSYQARSLLRAAQAAKRILQVGFNRRHIPLVRQAFEAVCGITRVNQVHGRFMKYGAAAFDKGGVAAFESDTIHAVDLVRWMSGGTAVAAATVQGQVDDVVPNSWNSVIRFDNGVTGVIEANYQTGGRTHTFEVHGAGASAFINLGMGGGECEARMLVATGKSGYSLAAAGWSERGPEIIDGKALAGSDKFYRYYGFYQEDAHFLDCVRHGKEPETNIEDAVKTFELVDLIVSSRI